MSASRPKHPTLANGQRSTPRNAERHDFAALYSLPEDEVERRILSMDEDEFSAFERWHDARLRKVRIEYQRRLSPSQRQRLRAAEQRANQPARMRIEGEPTTRFSLAVMDYLSGMHPLICRTKEDHEDLATVRAIADIIMEIMVESGVTDRHEAALIMEMRCAEAVRRRRGSLKVQGQNTGSRRARRNWQ